MGDTHSLLADDVLPGCVPSELFGSELYPENAAGAALLSRRLQRGDVAWEQDSSCVACRCGRRFNVLHRRHLYRCAQLHRRDTHAAV